MVFHEKRSGISVATEHISKQGICNLFCLFYLYGNLFSKSTGGHYHTSKVFAKFLLEKSCRFLKADFIKAVQDYLAARPASVSGIKIEGNRLFIELPSCSQEDLQLYCCFFQQLILYAQSMMRPKIDAKPDGDERYVMYKLFLKMKLKGPEYRALRNGFLKNLKGHSAFRNEEIWQNYRKKHLKEHPVDNRLHEG